MRSFCIDERAHNRWWVPVSDGIRWFVVCHRSSVFRFASEFVELGRFCKHEGKKK